MSEEDKETYECKAHGHTVGSVSFDAAPKDWFIWRNMPTPTWCPDCRAWRKNQKNQGYICQSCGFRFCVTSTTKIHHYFNEGPWQDPTECAKCARGERPVRRTGTFRRQVRPVRVQTVDFDGLHSFRAPSAYLLSTSPADYQRWNPNEGLTRQQHIEQHTTWSQFSRILELDSLDRKSPTSLGSQEPTFEGLLRSANIVAQATHPVRVREYIDNRSNNIIHVTLTDTNRLEVTVFKPTAGPNGHELITTFDNQTVQNIKNNLTPKANASAKWR